MVTYRYLIKETVIKQNDDKVNIVLKTRLWINSNNLVKKEKSVQLSDITLSIFT